MKKLIFILLILSCASVAWCAYPYIVKNCGSYKVTWKPTLEDSTKRTYHVMYGTKLMSVCFSWTDVEQTLQGYSVAYPTTCSAITVYGSLGKRIEKSTTWNLYE